ncbi:hypothetical protein DFP72DRAFT_913490 [Ephemerocybe angulata]|uniref:Uncharacterized protein n=1 Tax=Ephemerocybe angulata TaxID=980116 RepID=A0A8H6M061_9AGAR|nr:hypothetical protein DFP72DRAFT_913490 [Tulosesus angulatus]
MNPNEYAVIAPALVSLFEALNYWNGIASVPPMLLYRSDLESNRYPHPKPGESFFHIPVKTACGTFGTLLAEVWHIVVPLFIALFEERGISYSVIKAARFLIEYEDGKKTMRDDVVWVALHPGRNTAYDARDVTPDVLKILVGHGVDRGVVEWYEGNFEKLIGPPLLRVTNDTNPSYHVRRPLTVALGMPIAAKEMEADDSQGSVAFFFHENRDKKGAPSNRVLGVSNKHVLRKVTSVDYELRGGGAPRQHIRVCGDRRYKRFLGEIQELITKNFEESHCLAEEIDRLKRKPRSADPDEVADDAFALRKKETQLEEVEATREALETFKKTTDSTFNDIARRGIGWVDWAPKIAVDRHTLDIGTFELDPSKFRPHFKGNVVDLGSKFKPHELKSMFWPNDSSPTGRRFPSDRQLKIRGVVPQHELANPDCYDDNGVGMYVVAKDGNTTDLTVGRYAGLEAYLCDELGTKSVEAAIYNYSKKSSDFSAKGDSGSLIFTGDGRMLAVLHSGMLRANSNHVTFGTPAWWVLDRLKLRYKYAEFNREVFDSRHT